MLFNSNNTGFQVVPNFGTPLNFGSQLANGLLYSFFINPNFGNGAAGIVTYPKVTIGTLNGAGLTFTQPGRYGPSYFSTSTGNNAYCQFPEGSWTHPNGDISFFCIFNMGSLTQNPTFLKISGSAQDNYHFAPNSGVNNDGKICLILSNVKGLNSGFVASVNTNYAVLMSYRKGVQCDFWFKNLDSGTSVTTSVVDSTLPVRTAVGIPCLIGNNSTSVAAALSGNMYTIHLWGRYLNGEDFKILVNDPWTMYNNQNIYRNWLGLKKPFFSVFNVGT